MTTAQHGTPLFSANFLFSRLFFGFGRRARRRRIRLDPRELSPYLQRDLGLLDCDAVPPEVARRCRGSVKFMRWSGVDVLHRL